MVLRATGWMMLGVALIAAGCDARSLDPGMSPGGTGGTGGSGTKPSPPPPPPPESDLVATVRANSGPDKIMIIGVNGAVITASPTYTGTAILLPDDLEALDEAAGVVGMPVCSVESQGLTLKAAADPNLMDVPTALDACQSEDFGDVLAKLTALKTTATVVVIAANTAITVHSTNNGINFFYDTDMVRLLHAARKLYVPVCNVAPDTLSLPSPQGQTAGLSVEDALARCGRM